MSEFARAIRNFDQVSAREAHWADTEPAQEAGVAIAEALRVERLRSATVQWMPEPDGGCRFELISPAGDIPRYVRVRPDGVVSLIEGDPA